jgi:hypothetical protein
MSTGSVLADQFLRRWIKRPPALLHGQRFEVGQGLPASLAGVPAAGLLQIAEGLLAQAAVMAACAQLQQLMQWIWKVADLQGGHQHASQ